MEVLLPRCSYEQLELKGSGEDEETVMYGSTSSKTVVLKSKNHISVYSVVREQSVKVLQKAIKLVTGPLQKFEVKGIFVKTRELVEWNCVPLVVSFCCDITEDLDISEVQHSLEVGWSCVSCMVTRENNISSYIAYERLLRYAKINTSSLQVISRKNIVIIVIRTQ